MIYEFELCRSLSPVPILPHCSILTHLYFVNNLERACVSVLRLLLRLITTLDLTYRARSAYCIRQSPPLIRTRLSSNKPFCTLYTDLYTNSNLLIPRTIRSAPSRRTLGIATLSTLSQAQPSAHTDSPRSGHGPDADAASASQRAGNGQCTRRTRGYRGCPQCSLCPRYG